MDVYKDDLGKYIFFPDYLGHEEDLIKCSENEVIELLEKENKLNSFQYLLDSTQFKFGDDYDLKDTQEWLDLKAKRQEAREFIRAKVAEIKAITQELKE